MTFLLISHLSTNASEKHSSSAYKPLTSKENRNLFSFPEKHNQQTLIVSHCAKSSQTFMKKLSKRWTDFFTILRISEEEKRKGKKKFLLLLLKELIKKNTFFNQEEQSKEFDCSYKKLYYVVLRQLCK